MPVLAPPRMIPFALTRKCFPALLQRLFLLACLPVYCQIYPMDRFTREDGLPHFTVYSLFQDEWGYLLVGTRDGAVRFDGINMDQPYPEDTSIQARVYALFRDDSKRLWLGTQQGLYIAEPQQSPRLLSALSGVTVHHMLPIGEDILYVATSEGTYVVSLKDPETMVPYLLPLPKGSYHALAHDGEGGMWVGGSAGLFHVQRNDWWSVPEFEKLPIKDLVQTHEGLWILGGGQLYSYKNYRSQVVPVYSTGTLTCLAADQDNLWVGTLNGALFARLSDTDPNELKFRPLGPQQGLGHPMVHDILQDREGNIWFATEIGLCRLRSLAFRNYQQISGLLDNTVWAIETDTYGRTWFGSNRGISILTGERDYHYIDSEDGLPGGQVRTLEPDGHGGFWVATTNGLAHVRETLAPDGTFLRDIINFRGPCETYLRDVCLDHENRLWVATNNQGVCYGLPGSFVHLGTDDGLPSGRVFSIEKGVSGDVWMSTMEGLARYNHGQISVLTRNEGLPSNTVFNARPMPDGSVWVGTQSGLALVKDDEVKVYSRDNGLSNNVCYFVFPDSDQGTENGVWVGTNHGVNYFDGYHFQIFDSGHGLSFDELNVGAVHRDPQGRLWLGTYDGATRVESHLLPSRCETVSAHIEGMDVAGQTRNLDTQPILAHGENDVRFRFNGIFLTHPDSVRFSYRLKGLQDSWQEVRERFVTYPALPPGNYTFQVRAATRHGAWGPATQQAFTIQPPFWQTVPFYGLLALGMTGIMWWNRRDLKRSNRHLVKEKHALGQQVVQERANKLGREAELRLLHSQMNPHFLQNALNNAIYFSRVEPEKSERVLKLLSGLLRQAFNNTVLGETSLRRELDLIRRYLEIQRIRFGPRLNFEVALEQCVDSTLVPCFMLQPLVENAIVHGFKENLDMLDVRCHCNRRGSRVFITISNNGRPTRASLEELIAKGGALANIDKRLRLLYNHGLKYSYEEGRHNFTLEFNLARTA